MGKSIREQLANLGFQGPRVEVETVTAPAAITAPVVTAPVQTVQAAQAGQPVALTTAPNEPAFPDVQETRCAWGRLCAACRREISVNRWAEPCATVLDTTLFENWSDYDRDKFLIRRMHFAMGWPRIARWAAYHATSGERYWLCHASSRSNCRRFCVRASSEAEAKALARGHSQFGETLTGLDCSYGPPTVYTLSSPEGLEIQRQESAARAAAAPAPDWDGERRALWDD